MAAPLPIAVSGALELSLLPAFANRHGCITGATGTGKTVTLQRLAEGFCNLGVPVFLADVKGDLSGLAEAGVMTPKLADRLALLGRDKVHFRSCPVTFWDVWGQQGHPVRATVSDLGPLLLARLLNLNETQEGVLTIAFRVADDNGLLLLDLKDLRAILAFLADERDSVRTRYGNVSPASVGAIQRALTQLEHEGGERFFGEPMLDIHDLLQTDVSGRGVINVLAADQLLKAPRTYATFLLWLLSELFEQLPEVGDLEKPKCVFFFDEAHLLFTDAPAPLLDKIEQVVRLIRSKGVGVYFVTQSPLDIPERVLGQLGHRIQHALRAFTPRDQKAVRTVADTMRQNPELDVRTAITELAVGEALISLLDEQGTPTITRRGWVLPPESRIGPIATETRASVIQSSVVAGVYEQEIDRESAFERLAKRGQGGGTVNPKTSETDPAGPRRDPPTVWSEVNDVLFGSVGPRGGKKPGLVDTFAKSAARSVGTTVAREITRGLLGSLLGGKRR